jgi:hypothetical protein
VDWFEQLFGFSPDNGDGSLELLILLALAAALILSLILFIARRQDMAAFASNMHGVLGIFGRHVSLRRCRECTVDMSDPVRYRNHKDQRS